MIKFRKLTMVTIFNLIAVILIFVFVEGLASTALMVYRICNDWPSCEVVHTEYDDTLGWVNLPNLYVKNMYGAGIYFKTNGQRFRNNNEISPQTPINKVRIICSGDSFTMGYGVDNDHTWCQQLVSINPKLETVNMGQGGYGIDQAYLWYKRDGNKLNHDIHIFAFITDDFKRMQDNNPYSYCKPVLDLKNDVIATHNVPVPKPSAFHLWLNHNSYYFLELRSITILNKLFLQRNFANEYSEHKENLKFREIAMKLFINLHNLNNKKGSTLILVYLPVKSDYFKYDSEPWLHFLHDHAPKHNILFIDLIAWFRKLPSQTIEHMFISKCGHYTKEGNSYIAKVLYDKLRAIPELSDKLKLK